MSMGMSFMMILHCPFTFEAVNKVSIIFFIHLMPNDCTHLIYPKPQTGHLCGRWSEWTVICVKRPPRWVKLMPHNSQVNLRTAINNDKNLTSTRNMNSHSNPRQSIWIRKTNWAPNLRAFGGGGGFFTRFGTGALWRSFIWLSRWIFRRKSLPKTKS